MKKVKMDTAALHLELIDLNEKISYASYSRVDVERALSIAKELHYTHNIERFCILLERANNNTPFNPDNVSLEF